MARQSIAGEKINLIVLDDATDPTKAVQNTRKFVTEDKVDVIIGSSVTPIASAMADVAAEGETVQLMLSPVEPAAGQGRLVVPHAAVDALMAIPIVEHMKKNGVKTLGFLGFADAYGESWLTDIKRSGRARPASSWSRPSASRAPTPASPARR